MRHQIRGKGRDEGEGGGGANMTANVQHSNKYMMMSFNEIGWKFTWLYTVHCVE